MKNKKLLLSISIIVGFSLNLSVFLPPLPVHAARSIVFPVAGPASFSNDYNAPRPGGAHGAIDIIAPKMRPLLSAVDGVLTYVAHPEPSWGYMISIRDDDGYKYNYLHINNDTPGTNDGLGGGMNAYTADMQVGNRVYKGQMIGWVGDSGHANNVPHLHFEIITPGGERENPYPSLLSAERRSAPIAHYPQLPNELLPYGHTYGGGVNITRGNFDADPESETLVGAGRGGGPHIRLFDDNDAPMGPGFFAYNPQFYGGVDVAAGDVDGDGIDEIITGTIHGAPHVRVLRANGAEVGGFYAYAPDFSGGVDVTAGDVTGSSLEEVITAAGPGGGPHVRIVSATGGEIRSFYAYAPTFTGGVRISAENIKINSAKSEILVVPASRGGPHMRMFNGTASLDSEMMFLEPWWVGTYDVAAGYNDSRVSAGQNRRATIRHGLD